jgi:hypothetical protein
LQATVLFVCTQPLPGTHESSVQRFPSSQLNAAIPAHTPLAHTSPVVHAFPSSHVAVLFVWTHPVAGSQESSVHPLPSSQLSAGPPEHAPPLHTSPTVQASPSSHGAVLSV